MLRPFLEESVPLACVAREHGLVLRTVHRWLRRYRREGLAGLARKTRSDKHRKKLSPAFCQMIEGLALQNPRPSAATVHRRAIEAARELGEPPPSYSLVYALVREMEPALLTLAHDGTKAYQHTFDLLHCREASGPNVVWQADHTQLDLRILDAKGQPARPWLTIILDDYSRAIAGFGVSLSAPSAIHTALVLRQAIWRKASPHWHVCGIPETFYTDHGSDFTSHHLEQVSADLRMELVFSQAGMPRGRGKIERFFRSLNQLFLCSLPGYAPAGSACSRPTLTLSALESKLLTFLVEQYNQRVHGETGMAPQARWEQGGFLPRIPDSLEQLDLLLLTVATTRLVRRDGIHFQGFRYLDPVLAAYIGEPVMIRYDPRDMGEIRIFYRQQFLCRAVSPELAGETLSLRDIVQARTKRRRELRQTLRQKTQLVETLLEMHRGHVGRAEVPVSVETLPMPEEKTPGGMTSPLKRYVHD